MQMMAKMKLSMGSPILLVGIKRRSLVRLNYRRNSSGYLERAPRSSRAANRFFRKSNLAALPDGPNTSFGEFLACRAQHLLQTQARPQSPPMLPLITRKLKPAFNGRSFVDRCLHNMPA